ncbi:hypothetical protein [Hafnia paralvei]|uniref:hypothetical protein n=1 Tax=Hafnia paralvei TaxID=546367 RepID=UPI0024B89608|nr:hypothetical protein [Hafnia paralvei]
MTKLTTERLEKLQDDLLQFQDHYSDPADKENYDIFVDALHMLDEFKAAKEQLLAYEQAAKNPVAFVDERGGAAGGICWAKSVKRELQHGTELYAAPVLPKQPDPVAFEIIKEAWRLMDGQDPKTADWHFAASAYINAYNDTMPAQPEPENKIAHIKLQKALAWLKGVAYENPYMKEVKTCIEVLSAPAQPVIPEGLIKAINRLLDNDGSRGCFDALEQHRAKTELERLLATAQQNEAQNIPENIPAPLDAQDLELYVDMLENSDSDDEDGELNNTQLIVWLKELQRRRALSAQPVIPGQAQPVALILENHVFTELYKLEEIEIAQLTQKGYGGTITELFKCMPVQPVSEPYKLKDAVADIRNSGVEIDADKIKSERDALNPPVIPDGSADTKRLNWLDAQNARLNEYFGTSYGWKFDVNLQRSAMILNDCNFPVMTVRQAIDEAMLAAAPAQESE